MLNINELNAGDFIKCINDFKHSIFGLVFIKNKSYKIESLIISSQEKNTFLYLVWEKDFKINISLEFAKNHFDL